MPTHQYDDILNLPRPVSRRHRPMPLEDRAVQFAPFAALTSYEEILMEAARPTRDCPQLSEDEQTRLDAGCSCCGRGLKSGHGSPLPGLYRMRKKPAGTV